MPNAILNGIFKRQLALLKCRTAGRRRWFMTSVAFCTIDSCYYHFFSCTYHLHQKWENDFYVVTFACCSLFCPRGGGHNCGFYCASKRHAFTCCICTYILLLHPFCCCLQGLLGISSTHRWKRLLRFKKKKKKKQKDSCYIYSLNISLWRTVHKKIDEKVNGDKSIKIQKPYLIYIWPPSCLSSSSLDYFQCSWYF